MNPQGVGALATWDGSLTITDETIQMVRGIRDAEQKRAISLATGLVGYDLHNPAQVVVPIFTPVVNAMPRLAGVGIDFHHFKAITSFNWNGVGSIPGTVDENVSPSEPTYSIANFFNVFQTIGAGNSVSFKSQWRGRSLEGDVRAKRMAELIYILKIIEEQWLIYYTDYLPILPTPLAPTTAATGGTVAANTYYVGVTARSVNGETPVSLAASTITTSGSTSTITITFFTTPLASGYNVYFGTAAGNSSLNQVAAANLLVNGVAPTGNPATTGAITQSIPNLNGSITCTIVAAGAATHPPAANGAIVSKGVDNNPLTFNGIMGLIFGGGNSVYSSPNTAPSASFTAAGASSASLVNSGLLGQGAMTSLVAQPAASTGKIAYSDITNMLLAMFQNARANPDYMACSPQDNTSITNLLYNATGTRVVINADIPQAQGHLTLGTRVEKMMNPTTGKVLDVEVWPYLPQGTLIFGSRSLPFPVPGFDGPIARVITNQEYYGVDYPPTLSNPKYAFADYVDETLEIAFLGGFGAITGIIPG